MTRQDEVLSPDTLPTPDQGDDSSIVRVDIPLKGVKPEVAAAGIESFADLPLPEILRESIAKAGWTAPTPVQKLCLPFTLRGRDVAGFAQTGTGKTGVFLISILNRLLTEESPKKGTRALVLAPTRELAMQIEQDAKPMFAHAGLSTLAVYGGVDYDKQAKALKDGIDVIFATPGRLKDYVQKHIVSINDVTVFVCDEADRMFDMGFIEDVEYFLEKIPETAQKLLFSATTNEEVKELAFEYLETPEYISVNPETITPEKIEQKALHCHSKDKLKVLLGLFAEQKPDCAIIFTNTKLTAEWLYYKLSHNGIEADLISGDLPQKKRIALIHKIKDGKIKALVATDVASRGLHISRVTHVYNFDLPDDSANYVHRIGRTARAGAKGVAVSLVCDDYGQNLPAINALLGPIAMTTEWPPEEYLSLVDKAGNPFTERYKAVEDAKREREKRFNDSREPRSKDREFRGSRDHQQQKRPDHQQRRPDHQQKRPDHRQKRQGELEHIKGRSKHPERIRRHDERPTSHHHSHKHSKLPTQVGAPKGFFGMIKSIIKALFGGK